MCILPVGRSSGRRSGPRRFRAADPALSARRTQHAGCPGADRSDFALPGSLLRSLNDLACVGEAPRATGNSAGAPRAGYVDEGSVSDDVALGSQVVIVQPNRPEAGSISVHRPSDAVGRVIGENGEVSCDRSGKAGIHEVVYGSGTTDDVDPLRTRRCP